MVKLLDLCCGAGGCSMGYKRAADQAGISIEITGVDVKKQKNYPFRFIQWDAVSYIAGYGNNFTHIHASPPCQEYSLTTAKHKSKGKKYDSEIFHQVRTEMYKMKIPGVIENVPGSPVIPDIELNGLMFGLPIKRTRFFELVNWWMMKPYVPMIRRGAYLRGEILSVYGNGGMKTESGGEIQVPGNSVAEKRSNAMGIDWMSKMEMAQAIPPAYTQFIGEHFLKINL